jgi:hydroxypyruvate reductase
MLALMISDVPGDDPAMIGSGPTVGEAGTAAQARALVARYGIELPATAQAVLEGASGVIPPGDPRLSRVGNVVFAAPSQSLDAAADVARAQGIRVETLGDDLEGEARKVAREHAALARETQAGLAPGAAPVLLLSGGELTVTRRGDGVGGPNAEYALALALALGGAAGIHAIACDTDGVDGAAEVAGATVAPDTLARARAAGTDAEAALARNDAHGFFAAIGDQVVTGPTLTNVNDFRAILVAPA